MGISSSKAKSKRRPHPLHAPKGHFPYDYPYDQGYPPPWPQAIPPYGYGHPALMPNHPVIPPGFFPPQYPVQMPQPQPYQPPQPAREPQPAPQVQRRSKRKKTRRGPPTATLVFPRKEPAQAGPTNSDRAPVVPPPEAPRVSTSTRVSTGPPPPTSQTPGSNAPPGAGNHGHATPSASRLSHERRASFQAPPPTSQHPNPPAATSAPPVSSAPAPIGPFRSPEPLPELPLDVYTTTPFRHLISIPPAASEETVVANEEEIKEEPKKQKRGLFGALSGQKSGSKETKEARDDLAKSKVGNGRPSTKTAPIPQAYLPPPPPPGSTAPRPPNIAMTPYIAATPRMATAPHTAASPDPRPRSHSLASHGDEAPALKPIYFNQTTEDYTDFLNHSPHRVWMERVEYPTAAHLLQALQFLPHRPDIAENIRLTEDIVDAYQISFQYEDQIGPGYAHAIRENMETVALLKFHQHGELRDMLMETYPVPLIYDDPSDFYWGGTGVGPHGEPSENQLGRILEHIRERLIQESHR